MLSCIVVGQCVHNGTVFNYGHKFFRPWVKKFLFVAFYESVPALLWAVASVHDSHAACACFINCTFNSESGATTDQAMLFSAPYRWLQLVISVSNVAHEYLAERISNLSTVREWITSRCAGT